MNRYLLAMLLLLPQITFAIGEIKNNKLSGVISDQKNNTPLPGVSIFIPEIQKGNQKLFLCSFQFHFLYIFYDI